MDATINAHAAPPALAVTPTTSKLELSIIRTNGGTQTRAAIDRDVVKDYADAIKDGVTLPPIVVYYDGNAHWLADGFHRHDAAIKAGLGVIDAEVRQGTQRDAILHSVGANADHGFRRNNDDKHRAVQRLLDDPEWSAWSDHEIARRCHVSNHLVAKRRKLTGNFPSENGGALATERRFTTRHGTEATMKTGNIGTTKAPGRTITRTVDPEYQEMWNDPDIQHEAAVAEHDQQTERDERIGMSGAAAVEADNEGLRQQLAERDRTIARVTRERDALKSQVSYWKHEAVALGWKPAGENADAA